MTNTNTTSSGLRPDASPIWLWLAALGLSMIATYITIATLPGESPSFGVGLVASTAGISFLTFAVLAWRCRKMTSVETFQGIAIATIVSVIGLLTIDFAFTAHVVATMPQRGGENLDPGISQYQFYPPLYYPTERNFRLHKAGITVSGSHYGDYYESTFLNSPTLMNSVVTSKATTVRIDDHGFRDDISFGDAPVVALGDSFTFGWGVPLENTWVKQLQERIGIPTFNLGIYDSSPRQEVELLKYALSRYRAKSGPEHVIWQIYEGNDLEDSYSELAPTPRRTGIELGLGYLLRNLLRNLKDSMVIEHFRKGRVRFTVGTDEQSRQDHYSVDGVALATPIYYSTKLGPALFSKDFLERGSKSASYVLEHPNRAALDNAFDEMKRLALEYGFHVGVVIAPTAARLHGQFYDDFPKLSERPYFIDYVAEAAKQRNFGVVNLYELLAPCAGTELFYFRDDDHFSLAGHAAVAETIAAKLFGVDTTRECAAP